MKIIPKAQLGLTLLPADNNINPIKSAISGKSLFTSNLNPTATYISEVLNSVLNSGKLFLDRVKEAKENPSIVTIPTAITSGVNTIGEIALSPIGPIVSKIPIVNKILPYTDLTKTANLFNSKFYSDPTYKYLEHDYNDLGLPLVQELARIGNLIGVTKVGKGAIKAGKRSTKFIENIPNRNRFVFDNLNPVSYSGHLLEGLNVIKDMSTKNAPVFFDRYPKWYVTAPEHTSPKVRLETWARRFGIPELEIPNTTIRKRANGTYGFTRIALEPASKPESLFRIVNLDDLESTPAKTVISPDYITTVGGEHSTFVKLNDNGLIKTVEYIDDQKLNPQWKIADYLKTKTPKFTYNFIDKFGGIDLGPLIGAKSRVLFKLKFAYDTPDGTIIWDYN